MAVNNSLLVGGENGRQLLSVHSWSHPPNSRMQKREGQKARPQHRELRALLF